VVVAAFRRSLSQPRPPAGFSPALKALWFAAKDDWKAAHAIVMAHEDVACAWVHAHLHRVEGDLDNARYWYERAGRRPARGAFDAERTAIAAALAKRRP
jgi:hypothetical protein